MHFSRFVYGAFVKQITGRHVAACLTGCAPSWLFRGPHAPIFLGAYSAVWLAELAGDKTL